MLNREKIKIIAQLIVCVVVLVVVAGVVSLVVKRLRKPGQLDVVSAQSMDMSSMRPPAGAAMVDLADVKHGAIADAVVYSATIRPYNVEQINARVAGTVVLLPVYPGDAVRPGAMVARLDSTELSAKSAQAAADADASDLAARSARRLGSVHHKYAYEQSAAQVESAKDALSDMQSAIDAAEQQEAGAEAGLETAQANDANWSSEIGREKRLYNAGAVSLSEYQSEEAQAKSAASAVSDAKAKISEAKANILSAKAKAMKARHDLDAAQKQTAMSKEEIVLAQLDAKKQEASAKALHNAANEASVVTGYTVLRTQLGGVVSDRLVSPGTLVQPGTTILNIAQIDKVRVQAQVASEDLGAIKIGSPAEISVKGGAVIEAKVTSVFPVAAEDSRTALVEAVVANPGHRLIPGGFASIRFTKSASETHLLIPAASVVTSGDGSYVWIGKPDSSAIRGGASEYECEKCHMRFSAADAKKDKYVDPMDGGRLIPVVSNDQKASAKSWIAHRVKIEIGATDGVLTAVLSGDIGDGDKVVKRGMLDLREGDKVEQDMGGTK